MKLKKWKSRISLFMVLAMVFTILPSSLFTVNAEETILQDVAVYATITSDATSDWENLGGVINPSFEPTDSTLGAGLGWGNWSQAQGSAHYIQLEWEEEITTSSFDVYWYDDGGGTRIPGSLAFEYKDTDGSWKELTMVSKYEDVIAVDKYNRIEVNEVTTTGIRMNVTVLEAENSAANGVYRWKVYASEIPESLMPNPDFELPDAGVYAVPSSDYTSPWENLNGINNSDFEPTSSSMGNNLGWGNWSQTSGSEHWVQYDWDDPLTTKTFQVYWYGDSNVGGVNMPANVRFEYKDIEGNWKEATLLSDVSKIVTAGKYNEIQIEEITTTAIRMYMTVSSTGNATGIYRWKVYSDVSEAFVIGAAAKKLEIPEVFDGKVSSRIYDSLTLVSSALNGNVAVTWESSNTDVITNDGKITAPDDNTTVTMTATCTKGDVVKKQAYDIVVLAADATEFALTVDTAKEGVDISQELFGVFYEDINGSADGGIATEMVKNNSFENYQNIDTPETPVEKGDQTSWKLHWESSNASDFVVETTGGLNENNTNHAKITGNMTLKNHGFVRKATMNKSAMAITADKTYDFSIYVKAAAEYAGTLKVKVVNDAGNAITDEAAIELKKDGTWQKVTASLTGTKTELGTIVLTFAGAADTDVIYIDMVSLIPTDSYGYGNKNYSYGAGLRSDLIQKLKDLNPKFIRFPGGCIIEGSYGTDSYYNWEDTVGPLEERKANASYWGTIGHPVNYTPGYGYMMSYQFGYHEILTLCEDLGAQAFPILSAGIYCQFRDTANAASGDDLEPFAKHATNLIDYCWGSPDSDNETQAYWASKRVENGHSEVFDLNYVGIGNENWNDAAKGISYKDNFLWIKNYIDAYVEKNYPGRSITIISSTGPYYQGSQNTEAWNWINANVPGETLVDEHYYINYTNDSNNTLLNDDYVYDTYKRLDEGGSNVFVGEYAGHVSSTTENVLETAISEAAYMTGLERNGDIVRHASYAPLFEKEGCRDWDYNLIKFDEYGSYGTPSYYVQSMYANNYGKKIVNTTLQKLDNTSKTYVDYAGHQPDVYYVSSKTDNYVYLKLVNHADFAKDITLSYPGVKDGIEAEIICLSGDAMDQNTMDNPTNVAPVTTKVTIKDEKLLYTIPAMSLTVLKVNYTGTPDVTDPTEPTDPASKPTDPTNTTTVTTPGTTTNPTTSTEAPSTPVVILKKGDKITKNGVIYKVTDAAKKQLEAYRPVNKKAKKLTIAGAIKVKGVTCKVTSIATSAFANMKKLNQVTIPKSVTKIGKKAFYKAKQLKKVKIKSTSLKIVGKNAFTGIAKKAIIDVPNKKVKNYKKLFKKAKVAKTVKVK